MKRRFKMLPTFPKKSMTMRTKHAANGKQNVWFCMTTGMRNDIWKIAIIISEQAEKCKKM